MSAIISECGQYRYVLRRQIEPLYKDSKVAVFIMLNPSTADATQDDPTIRRCIGFAKRERCTHLSVVNLFALRSTDPAKLVEHTEPAGPENLKYIIQEVEKAHLVIAAWGSHPMTKCSLATELSSLKGIVCLGKTKSGKPRHPLYVRNDVVLESLT